MEPPALAGSSKHHTFLRSSQPRREFLTTPRHRELTDRYTSEFLLAFSFRGTQIRLLNNFPCLLFHSQSHELCSFPWAEALESSATLQQTPGLAPNHERGRAAERACLWDPLVGKHQSAGEGRRAHIST